MQLVKRCRWMEKRISVLLRIIAYYDVVCDGGICLTKKTATELI